MLVLLLAAYYAAPLSTLAEVVRWRCSASLHWPLVTMNAVNSALWTAYGVVGGGWALAGGLAGSSRGAPAGPSAPAVPSAWKAHRCAGSHTVLALRSQHSTAPLLGPPLLLPPPPTAPPPPVPQAIQDWFIAGPQAYGTAASCVALALCVALPRQRPGELPSSGAGAEEHPAIKQ